MRTAPLPLLLAAAALLALVAPAHAARQYKSIKEPACYPNSGSAARYCGIQWTTDEHSTLTYKSQNVLHGYMSDILPGIPANSFSLAEGGCAESAGFMTGTEGTLYYNLEGCGELAFYWDVPYVGSNAYSCTVGCADYMCDYKVWDSDGQGKNVVVGLIVMKKAAV